MLCRYVAPESESEFESAEARKKRRTESAASSSGSSSSSSDGEDAELRGPSGLLMSQLISMNEGNDQDSSKYAAQGKSRERVKTVLKEPCCRKSARRNSISEWFSGWFATFGHWAKHHRTASCGRCKTGRGLTLMNPPVNQGQVQSLQNLNLLSNGDQRFLGRWKTRSRNTLFFRFNNSSNQFKPVQTLNYAWIAWLQPGIPVCRLAFIKLLGISPARLVRSGRTFKGVDGRAWGFLAKILSW